MPETDTTEDVAIETMETEADENADPQGEAFDPQRAMTTIKTLRAETKTSARALREATAKLQAFEDAQLSESERLQKQLADLTAERDGLVRDAQTAVAGNAITAAASAAGAIRPDAIAKLIDISKAEIDGGAVANADDLVSEIQTAFPELFHQPAQRPGNADAGAGKGKPTGASFNDTLRRQLGQ
jgi:hypothetical protein